MIYERLLMDKDGYPIRVTHPVKCQPIWSTESTDYCWQLLTVSNDGYQPYKFGITLSIITRCKASWIPEYARWIGIIHMNSSSKFGWSLWFVEVGQENPPSLGVYHGHRNRIRRLLERPNAPVVSCRRCTICAPPSGGQDYPRLWGCSLICLSKTKTEQGWWGRFCSLLTRDI